MKNDYVFKFVYLKDILHNIKYVFFYDKYSYFEFVLYSLCILLYYFLKNFTSTFIFQIFLNSVNF